MFKRVLGLMVLLFLSGCRDRTGEPPALRADPVSVDQILGRWNLEFDSPAGSYPSWLEISLGESDQLSGRFVGRMGGSQPLETIEFEAGLLQFSLPGLDVAGEWVDSQLRGAAHRQDGAILRWTAVRAPDLKAPESVQWGEPIRLFNGRDLEEWKPRRSDLPNYWQAEGGVLVNAGRGTDLMTQQKFRDFRLSLEFRYPEGGNSGVYLRGRYEVQIQDDYGRPPENHYTGGIYGFLPPLAGPVRPAGQWQSFDITLLGRRVTVVLNGVTVLDDQEIPGITGGALDSQEAQPGPILLQGDHGPVAFRNIVLTPVL